ncbi:unnamed protein product [Staurois parvus]|uniref:Histone H2A n=1 Tax=Staurois parvus TaxID=386267 RepID=A0ABN9ELW9_9NEOB|nr:unnamed protein product [Staurois parvus]
MSGPGKQGGKRHGLCPSPNNPKLICSSLLAVFSICSGRVNIQSRAGAPICLPAVLEYLMAEIFNLATNATFDKKNSIP